MPQRYISIYAIQLSLKVDSTVSSMCIWQLCKLEIQLSRNKVIPKTVFKNDIGILQTVFLLEYNFKPL